MAQTTPKLGLTKPELSDLITDTIPALAANFDKLESDVVEYGTNANGSYLRFPFLGIQICWFDYGSTLTTSIASVSIYVSNAISWTYPKPFAARPVVIPATRYGGSGGGGWGRVAGTPSATDVPVSVVGASASYTGIPTPVAIGTYTP